MWFHSKGCIFLDIYHCVCYHFSRYISLCLLPHCSANIGRDQCSNGCGLTHRMQVWILLVQHRMPAPILPQTSTSWRALLFCNPRNSMEMHRSRITSTCVTQPFPSAQVHIHSILFDFFCILQQKNVRLLERC